MLVVVEEVADHLPELRVMVVVLEAQQVVLIGTIIQAVALAAVGAGRGWTSGAAAVLPVAAAAAAASEGVRSSLSEDCCKARATALTSSPVSHGGSIPGPS